jgi:hypothetical protein
MIYELRVSATRDEEKVDICYKRSGDCIDLDLLDLLCYTCASCQVRGLNAPPHGPHRCRAQPHCSTLLTHPLRSVVPFAYRVLVTCQLNLTSAPSIPRRP